MSLSPGIGIKTYQKLVEEYGSVQEVRSRFLANSLPKAVMKAVSSIDLPPAIKELSKLGISYVCHWEPEYPYLLKEIPDAPIILYYCGDLTCCTQSKFVSVVGTRKFTSEGARYSAELVRGLVNSGVVIVSGMAFGIDSVAHRAALDSGGKTIAVLAAPPNRASPLGNNKLYSDILSSGGLVVSEAFPGIAISDWMFASRNRIIAGLTQATVVSEAGIRSGALITANLAFEYGREVFACPVGFSGYSSSGTNQLIKINRAHLLEGASDILSEMGWSLDHGRQEEEQKVVALPNEVQEVYRCLLSGAKSLEEVCLEVDRNAGDVISFLMALQIEGLCFQDNWGNYCAVR